MAGPVPVTAVEKYCDESPAPPGKDFRRLGLMKYVYQAIEQEWEIEPEVYREIPDLLRRESMHAKTSRERIRAAQVLAQLLSRDELERGRLALDTEKFETMRKLAEGGNGTGARLIDIEITQVRARLEELQDPSLGRSLVPGLPEFRVEEGNKGDRDSER